MSNYFSSVEALNTWKLVVFLGFFLFANELFLYQHWKDDPGLFNRVVEYTGLLLLLFIWTWHQMQFWQLYSYMYWRHFNNSSLKMKNTFQTFLGVVFYWSNVQFGFGWWPLPKNLKIRSHYFEMWIIWSVVSGRIKILFVFLSYRMNRKH